MPVKPVELVGIEDVLHGLSFIDEDMHAKIRIAIKAPMMGVANKAKGFVPGQVLSGWSKPISGDINYKPFPKYNPATIRAGIGYNDGENQTYKNGFKVSNYVYNVSAAGRIYETAGRLNPQGRAPFTSIHAEGAGVVAYKDTRGRSKARSTASYDSNNPFAGYQFVTAMGSLTSQTRFKGQVGGASRKTKGRLIYKAWSQDSVKVYTAIVDAINATATKFNKSTQVKKKVA
jgi:hypothetical protein